MMSRFANHIVAAFLLFSLSTGGCSKSAPSPQAEIESQVSASPKREPVRRSEVPGDKSVTRKQVIAVRSDLASENPPEKTAAASPSVMSVSTGQSTDLTSRENDGDQVTTASPEPPVRLVDGKPIPGVRLVFAKVTIEGDDYRMEIEQAESVRFGPSGIGSSAKPARPDAGHAKATTSGFQIGLKRERIDFEIRPVGGKQLQLDSVVEETPLTGPHVVEYLWKEQPYEILDRNLRVVFCYPHHTATLGEQRKPLPKNTPAFPSDVPPLDLLGFPPDTNMEEFAEEEMDEIAESTVAERAQAAKRAAEIEAAKWRTWTTADGKHTVQAKFVKLGSGRLTLAKKDGTTFEVNFDLLSQEDQQFVKKRKWTESPSTP